MYIETDITKRYPPWWLSKSRDTTKRKVLFGCVSAAEITTLPKHVYRVSGLISMFSRKTSLLYKTKNDDYIKK